MDKNKQYVISGKYTFLLDGLELSLEFYNDYDVKLCDLPSEEWAQKAADYAVIVLTLGYCDNIGDLQNVMVTAIKDAAEPEDLK